MTSTRFHSVYRQLHPRKCQITVHPALMQFYVWCILVCKRTHAEQCSTTCAMTAWFSIGSSKLLFTFYTGSVTLALCIVCYDRAVVRLRVLLDISCVIFMHTLVATWTDHISCTVDVIPAKVMLIRIGSKKSCYVSVPYLTEYHILRKRIIPLFSPFSSLGQSSHLIYLYVPNRLCRLTFSDRSNCRGMRYEL